MMDYRGMKQLTKEEMKYCSEHIDERECKEKVFESYMPYVIKLSSIISEKNPYVDTEDIINEGMIGLWKAMLYYNPEKGYTIFALIKTCVRNSILEYVKKMNKHVNVGSLDVPTIEGEEETMLYDIIEDTRFDMDREVYSNEIVSMFDELLTERDKNVMEDFFIRQIKQKDIVEKYNLSGQGHVGLIISRSKKKIRKALA